MSSDGAPGLFERDDALARLRARALALGRGEGGCVLVEGDAGMGKTSLLQAWRRAMPPGEVDWWWGSCEPLLAPPPLAPLLDMLPALPPRLADAVRGGRVDAAFFADLLSLLRDAPRPVVLVVEDAHWADGRTLDLLRFVGRRLASTRALLVLSWREPELTAGHPLRTVLAGLDPARTHRIALSPLTPTAVAGWARQAGRDAGGLHAATGGNPFFVAQLLAAPPGVTLPAQLRDALLAGVARLPAEAREVLEVVSLSPVALEVDLLQATLAPTPEAMQAALHSGLLRQEGESLRLAHELARAALAESLGPRAAALHAVLFDALGSRGASLARLVHHAELAGLAHAVVRLAPQAARQAGAARAHRQAAALYAMALRHRALLSADDERMLAEAHADECLLINQVDEAMASRERALALARAAGDAASEARQLRVMARIEWIRGRPGAGMALADAALALLDRIDPGGREWAMASLTMGQLQLLADHPLRACDWVDRALPRLRAHGDREAEAYALNTAGAARLGTAEEAAGIDILRRALAMALEAGQEELAARAWTNLAAAALVQHRLDDLARETEAAIAYCRERDLELFAIHLCMRQALGLVAGGRWSEGMAMLDALAARGDLNPVQRDQLPWLRGMMAVRTGRPGAGEAWRRLAETGPPLSPTPWYMDPALMRLEAAWLLGDDALARRVAVQAWDEPAQRRDGWRRAELAVWRRRLGLPAPADADWPEPARRALAGDAAGAAAAWDALGMPYDAALALADGGEVQQRTAVARLQSLGALPAVRRLRAALRAAGAQRVPRGPYARARADGLGLTARQREVLDALRAGLSNREIADRLHRSERTVENHVAALIEKLGARDRQDAVRLAGEN